MTEKELMGPTGFWLETLRKDEQPKREYLTLADAVAQLNWKLDDLLNEGIARKLDLYAPVLREGLYAWPVTDRGIPHANLVGSIAGVESVFRSVLRYGEYAVLLPADIKKIKIEQSVKPSGYKCPELVLRHTAEWQQEQQQQEQQQPEQAAMLAERMKGRANSVAWVLAYPPATDTGVVKLEMLRVDSGDVQRLLEQSSPSDEAQNVRGINEPSEHLYLADKVDGPVSMAVRNKIAEYPFRGEMSSAIARAVHVAADPENFHSVWEELLKLAERKVPPLLGVSAEGQIQFRSRRGPDDIYEKSSLEKSLGRAVKSVKSSHKTP